MSAVCGGGAHGHHAVCLSISVSMTGTLQAVVLSEPADWGESLNDRKYLPNAGSALHLSNAVPPSQENG